MEGEGGAEEERSGVVPKVRMAFWRGMISSKWYFAAFFGFVMSKTSLKR